jgi:type IV secretory pathway component VirB8
MPYGESEWASETLDDESQKAFYKAAVARQEGIEKAADRVLKVASIIAAGGVLVAVLGVGAAWTVYAKTPVPLPPGYIYIDRSTGVFFNPIKANEVAASYPESVRRTAIRDFIVACESYIPETWKDVDYHACMIRATPDEQKRRAAEIGPGGDRFPPTTFGAGGYAVPVKFSQMQPKGTTGSGPLTTYAYDVRYTRTEVAQNKTASVPWTAHIAFQFRPELGINGEDRLINQSGLQVVSFSTVKD